MNVPVITLPVGASGTVTSLMGQTPDANSGVIALGELFSLQIGSVLQNLQAEEEGLMLGKGLSEEEQQALEELMALVQQLLVIQQGGQEVEAFLAENGKSMELLTQKLQAPLPQLTNEWKQLLTHLTNQEPVEDQTQKLAALLQGFVVDKKQVQDKPALLLTRQEGIPAAPEFHNMGKMIQPIRIQQGLSAYKQEAGIQAQTVRTQMVGMMSPERIEENSQQPLTSPLKASARTLQTAQTFQMPERTEGNSQQPLTNPLTASAGTLQTAQTFQMPDGVRTYSVPANQFPQEVTHIFVRQMNLAQANGLHQAKLVLNPQSLGQVNVTITSENGVITAHFIAETQAGKDLLDNQLFHLRTALAQNGLQVDRLEVTQQPSADSLNSQQQREQAKQHQEQQPQHRDQQDEQKEFVLESLVDDDEWTSSLWNRSRDTTRRVHDLV